MVLNLCQQMSVMRASTDSKTTYCNNTRSTQEPEPIYYDTECVRTFQMQELHFRSDDFTFNIHPNIFGSQNYNQIGANVSISLLTGKIP